MREEKLRNEQDKFREEVLRLKEENRQLSEEKKKGDVERVQAQRDLADKVKVSKFLKRNMQWSYRLVDTSLTPRHVRSL